MIDLQIKNDGFNDALREMVACSSFAPKELALYLWPEMTSVSSAVAKFHAKLNADTNDAKDGHFTPEQVVALMAKTRQFQPLYFMCAILQHERPQRVSSDDLTARKIAAMGELSAAIEQATALLSSMR